MAIFGVDASKTSSWVYGFTGFFSRMGDNLSRKEFLVEFKIKGGVKGSSADLL